MNCPKCQKPMIENPKWPGQWSCPDYKKALNDRPPFRFKCTGQHLTEEGEALFEDALLKAQASRN